MDGSNLITIYLLAPGVPHSGLLPGQGLLPPIFLTVGGDVAREGSQGGVGVVRQLDGVAEVWAGAGLHGVTEDVLNTGAEGGQRNTTRTEMSTSKSTFRVRISPRIRTGQLDVGEGNPLEVFAVVRLVVGVQITVDVLNK